MKISFWGAARVVTGSCHRLTACGKNILIDCGLQQGGDVYRENALTFDATAIDAVCVTHAHSDHILGVIWVVRMVAQCKGYEGVLHVYGHDKVLKVVKTIANLILAKKQLAKVAERVVFHELTDGDSFSVGDMRLTCFDIHSTKEKQFGFRAELPDNTSLACLGDEPYNPLNRPYIEHSDWMLCEAFCLYADRDTFKPYEKNHSTALDAGRLAAELSVKNLLLYHTEDKTLDTRRKSYTQEAATHFKGGIVVPDDLEVVEL